jgi:UDP-N-acetyl-D-glucosamine dehydrogenase
MTYAALKQAIKRRKITAAVVGLGYVGMPTALAIAKAGIKVIGFDISRDRVRQVNSGKSFIADITDAEIKTALAKLKATSDPRELARTQVVVIAVPTPLTKNKAPDTSYIETATKMVVRQIKKGTLVILESTTYPGTTEELVKPIFEKNGFIVGKDVYLAFSPERIDPGNKEFRFADIPKVVGGIDEKSGELAVAFYGSFMKHVYKVSSTKVAEMTKLLENIFRLVNISLVNELKMTADKMGIDFWEVIEAAKTKPYGFMPFYPGPGVGGHCIPLDPFYLSWKAREYNHFTRFIDLAGEINELMPHHIVTKVIWVLNKMKKAVRGSKILILGAAYKKDIDDPRESAALPVIWDLLRKGGDVMYNDPYIPELMVNHPTHPDAIPQILKSTPLSKELIKRMDCVVIMTDHSDYDYEMIGREAKLVVDTRNGIKKKLPNVFN